MKNLFAVLLLLFITNSGFSQITLSSEDFVLKKNNCIVKGLSEKKGPSAVNLILLIAVIAVNPIIVYENEKFSFGTTRELSLAFGKYSQYRTSFEYSLLFRQPIRHHFRASIKYDIQLNKSRGEFFNDQTVLTIGAGYFWDKEGKGVFPEITAGFKIGEQLLIYPYAKLRHTFMITKDKPDITDFSIGAILGYRLF